jgi:hypothetical protein
MTSIVRPWRDLIYMFFTAPVLTVTTAPQRAVSAFADIPVGGLSVLGFN